MSRDVITAPCLIDGMDEDWYHQDTGPVPAELGGSLSQSGAKKLLAPSCPAIYKWERDHPPAPSSDMEMGTVVHGILLGTGQPVEVIDASDWRTNKAKDAKAAALERGAVPMLPHQHAEAQAIAQAVLNDPECGALLADGKREVSGFWVDEQLGIWLRMRMDSYTAFGMLTIVDIKTAASSAPDKFAKNVAEYRYDMQDWWYRDGLAAILGCHPDDVDCVFLVVPTSEPYLPMLYRLEDDRDRANAERDCRRAREIYRDCTKRDVWPKWSRDIHPLSLPGHARKRIEEGINEYYR